MTDPGLFQLLTATTLYNNKNLYKVSSGYDHDKLKLDIRPCNYVKDIIFELPNSQIVDIINIRTPIIDITICKSFVKFMKDQKWYYPDHVFIINLDDIGAVFYTHYPVSISFDVVEKHLIGCKSIVYSILPPEIWDMVQKKLDLEDWISFSNVCKDFYKLATFNQRRERCQQLEAKNIKTVGIILDTTQMRQFRDEKSTDYIHHIEQIEINDFRSFRIHDSVQFIIIPDKTVEYTYSCLDEYEKTYFYYKVYTPLNIKLNLNLDASVIIDHVKNITVSKPTKIFVGYGTRSYCIPNYKRNYLSTKTPKDIEEYFFADDSGTITINIKEEFKESPLIAALIIQTEDNNENVNGVLNIHGCYYYYDYFTLNVVNPYRIKIQHAKNKFVLVFSENDQQIPITPSRLDTLEFLVKGLVPGSKVRVRPKH